MSDPPPFPPTGPTGDPAERGPTAPPAGPSAPLVPEPESPPAPLVGSARAVAAGEAVRALAHVARSFVLYDAANERIRTFLEDVRARFEAFHAAHGEMPLEIRPWDIVLGGEVVYTDKDRERSLAFRLYRDGVRRLTLHAEFDWPELVLLIGILSVRYKGVRTQEDDVVTLLWRAGFKHIDIGAVEGVVASEDDATDLPSSTDKGAGGPRDAMQAMVFGAPYAFAYPWPNLTERVKVERVPLPPPLLTRITEEEGAVALAAEGVQLVRELLTGLVDPNDPLALADVAPALREIRGFLVGEQRFEALLEVIRSVAAAPGLAEDDRTELLGACVDEEVVRRFMLSVRPTETAAPPALVELLTVTPGDHLATLLDIFMGSARQRSSPVLSQLLESQLKGRVAPLLERLQGADETTARDLFRMLVRADPAGSVEAALTLVGRPEMEVQLEAVRVLDAADYSGRVGRALVGALASGFPEVRAQALATLVKRREARAFDALAERVRRCASDLSAAESRASGEGLARLDPTRARALFREWVRPSGLLGRLSPAQTALRWVAVAGLALLPGADAEELLGWLSRHAADDLARQSGAALARLKEPPGAHRD